MWGAARAEIRLAHPPYPSVSGVSLAVRSNKLGEDCPRASSGEEGPVRGRLARGVHHARRAHGSEQAQCLGKELRQDGSCDVTPEGLTRAP